MSQQGMEQLIGKALADENFLDDFLKDPEGKIKECGLDISAEEMETIKRVDSAKAKQFAKSFGMEFGSRKQFL
ncbi:MAG: Os1348 family NHLP clan protein [Chlamydiota bacterium]|nr:Os1348 family NHLP clan protein [Chlamydiota bacterium]